MSEWRLIETAPHGLDVLMGWVECHSKEWKCEVGQASYGWSINGISNMSRHGSATHWMPLPGPHGGALKTEASTITPALDATAEREPVAWRIRVRERGGTTYHVYTERLPFEPDADSGIIAIGKAVPVFALDDIHWNEIRSAVTQQFEKTLEYLGKTEKE